MLWQCRSYSAGKGHPGTPPPHVEQGGPPRKEVADDGIDQGPELLGDVRDDLSPSAAYEDVVEVPYQDRYLSGERRPCLQVP